MDCTHFDDEDRACFLLFIFLQIAEQLFIVIRKHLKDVHIIEGIALSVDLSIIILKFSALLLSFLFLQVLHYFHVHLDCSLSRLLVRC